ncbi:hypothetical protein LX32DRAFT_95270 [Colletotrichum zoysiae]|uniref:Uncharacterized protein n=1 Tax=Colletotrichum zoysiae TaxID=1216348 RepID=A0AAD9H8X6_9PEZI|nr:hypothetical protein LX32DRAFT_95270 [Colletotrichum zoysiae]
MCEPHTGPLDLRGWLEGYPSQSRAVGSSSAERRRAPNPPTLRPVPLRPQLPNTAGPVTLRYGTTRTVLPQPGSCLLKNPITQIRRPCILW